MIDAVGGTTMTTTVLGELARVSKVTGKHRPGKREQVEFPVAWHAEVYDHKGDLSSECVFLHKDDAQRWADRALPFIDGQTWGLVEITRVLLVPHPLDSDGTS